MTLFTGSQHVAEKLTAALKGRVKLEDAGFDWKVRHTNKKKKNAPTPILLQASQRDIYMSQ